MQQLPKYNYACDAIGTIYYDYGTDILAIYANTDEQVIRIASYNLTIIERNIEKGHMAFTYRFNGTRPFLLKKEMEHIITSVKKIKLKCLLSNKEE